MKETTPKPLKYMKPVVKKLLTHFKVAGDLEKSLLGTDFNSFFKLPHIKHMHPDRVDKFNQKMVHILKGFVGNGDGSSTDRPVADNPTKKLRFWVLRKHLHPAQFNNAR